MEKDKTWLGLLLLLMLTVLAGSSSATSTPQTTPTPGPQQLIGKSAARMVDLDTASFTLSHEDEASTNLFPGVDLNLIEGQVNMPDSFKIQVEAMTSFPLPRSFIQIDAVAAEGRAYMTDILIEGKWNEVTVDSLPFDFSDLGRTLSEIILAMENPHMNGTGKIGGVPTIRVKGTVPSEIMKSLVALRTSDGKPVRLLTVVDEYTRECLAIQVGRSLRSSHVIECLGDIMVQRGVPDHVRSDNGPEFTARAVRLWLQGVGSTTLFITPGSPWENGYVESFNGKLRGELLDRELFDTLWEVQVLTEQWRHEYNHQRPHSALGYRPPAPEAILTSSAPSAISVS